MTHYYNILEHEGAPPSAVNPFSTDWGAVIYMLEFFNCQ